MWKKITGLFKQPPLPDPQTDKRQCDEPPLSPQPQDVYETLSDERKAETPWVIPSLFTQAPVVTEIATPEDSTQRMKKEEALLDTMECITYQRKPLFRKDFLQILPLTQSLSREHRIRALVLLTFMRSLWTIEEHHHLQLDMIQNHLRQNDPDIRKAAMHLFMLSFHDSHMQSFQKEAFLEIHEALMTLQSTCGPLSSFFEKGTSNEQQTVAMMRAITMLSAKMMAHHPSSSAKKDSITHVGPADLNA